MLLLDRKYFKPSKEARVLAILDSLAHDSGLSQNELGKRMGLSGAMVNQYLKEMQDDRLIQFEAVNGKSYRYVLTPQGKRSRLKMFSAYSSETIQIYTALKNLILDRLKQPGERGVSRLALFGASETCEVVLSTLANTPFDVICIVDNDPDKQGKLFNGHVVAPPEVLKTIQCQAVLITSFGRQDEIFEQLQSLTRGNGLEILRL